MNAREAAAAMVNDMIEAARKNEPGPFGTAFGSREDMTARVAALLDSREAMLLEGIGDVLNQACLMDDGTVDSGALLKKPWWGDWMKRIRWNENPAKSYAKQGYRKVESLEAIKGSPVCRCGAEMKGRAGYQMGGRGDWIAYECPNDRPWEAEKHDPWTTLHFPRMET